MSFTNRRLIVILSLCFCMLLVAACSQKSDDVIRFGLDAAPVNLDPRFATDATSYRITRLLYHSLVGFDDALQFVPDLATWEKLTNHHYRFYLDTEDTIARTFHSDERLTAHDVKATYEYILDPKHASPHQNSIAIIERIDVVDEDTIDFILRESDPLFPARLVVGIMPASLIAIDHPFNQLPVGSGPFVFHEWLNSSDLALRRLSDNQMLHFITVKEQTVRVLKLLRDELDIVQGGISREIVTWLEEKGSMRIEKAQGNTFSYIGFNLADEITGQLAIRKAIGHAINRDEIILHVMANTARKAGGMFPPTHWAAHPDLSGIEYDPQTARHLLKSAGYDENNPVHLIYKTSSNPFRVRLATIIQHQLKQVGIALDVRSYDWGTFYADIKAGNFQMYSLSWVGLKTPNIFRYAFHSESLPPNGANRGRLIDQTLDSMIETVEKQVDLVEQAKQYRDIQAYLDKLLPYIPLWYEDNILITTKNIHGYTLAADGNYDSLRMVTKH